MLGRVPGVMVLAIKDLFSNVRRRSCDGNHVVHLSYLEVYNGTVRDLLSPGRPLVLREDKQRIVAAGLAQYHSYSIDEVDDSFHSPEWHAARFASLKTSHTVTWEEYKKKQKEDELKKGELEADKDRTMREYRAQLDAERATKLAHGRSHSNKSSKSTRPTKKDKDLKKHRSSKKRKHSRKSSESSSSDSSSFELSSSSDDDSRESKRSRSRSRKRKDKRHRSKSKHLSGDEEADGPLSLSRFFGNTKS